MIPSEENVIRSLEENILQRNVDVLSFYELLMAQEKASSIAIDGRWGSGKTFFVKQTMLLVNAKNPVSTIDYEKKENIIKVLKADKDMIDEPIALAVYFDAWANDNDIDPVLSVIYEITKQLSLEYSFKDQPDFFKLAGSVISGLSGFNVESIISNLTGNDPLEQFKNQKSLESKIIEFFSDILNERGNRLIVFIDELDRCKPSFAVKLLEKIKHYLNDDRITFVFSVNLGELQHTIKQYYGSFFDSCRYLDKFFDMRVSLPPVNKQKFYEKMGLNSSFVLEEVTRKFIDIYNLELREISRYYRQVRTAAYKHTHKNDNSLYREINGRTNEFMLLYIVPITIGLAIVDISLYDDFVLGKDPKPLLNILDNEENHNWVVNRALRNNESFEDETNKTKILYKDKIIEIYNAIFATKYSVRNYEISLGDFRFDCESKNFILRASTMLSKYASFDI